MGHDAFAHHGLGSAALLLIGSLHARPAQTVGELVGSSSVSRATIYRTVRRLADQGLVHHSGETWTLAPRALEGFGSGSPEAATEEIAKPAQG
ncbi:MarR family transcriptional regulator [Streptomyces sp. NPDC050619]|uniref:MarR family transcriptional regulator n=1 Tax=Streptomyces sp. NPDC050619 TaxID=3157214 RepID=UPI00343847AF